MNFKRILITITLFLFGFVTVIAVDSYFSHPQEILPPQEPTPTPTPVTLVLPSNAWQGKLTHASGKVKRMPWDKTEFEEATAGAVLYQADELATLATSTADIMITASISGKMYENTDLLLGSLLPGRLAINQKTGTAHYQTHDPNQSLSIKSLGALTQLNQGSMAVSIENSIISVSLAAGNATLAYINNDNVTHVWKLTSGDTAIINDVTGRVQTTGQLLPESDQ